VSRPVALLDCDGVLADFVGGFLKLLGATTDRWFTPEQVTHFDIGASLGLSPAESAAAKRAISSTPGFCSALAVLPGAVDGVRALREIADVYIVTSPWNSCPTWTHEREAWLKRHLGIPHSHVVHTSAKHLVRGDVFVDDKTEAVIAWQVVHPRGIGVQWHTPHNRLDEWSGPSTKSWAHVEAMTLGGRQ
jgi:5'(3')-deoxyribonucleotidase